MIVRSHKGFTLAEMLVVIGIMLVLMVSTFGIFTTMAQQAGPGAAAATVQAMLNGARDYAASNGVSARVHFTADPTKPTDGTTMTLQYLDTDGTTWLDVPARMPLTLHNQMFVCKGMPPASSLSGVTVPSSTQPGSTGTSEQWDSYTQDWKKYQAQMLVAVTGFAVSNGQIASVHQNFYVTVTPTGSMQTDIDITGSNADGFTIVQMGGPRVVAYEMFPLNSYAGTPILFQ